MRMHPLHSSTHPLSRPHYNRIRPVVSWRRMPAILLAAAGLLALLAGCGVSTHSGATTASTPTATPPPQLHLNWQPMTMPPQANITPYTLGFAPSDGDVIYACAVDPRAGSQQLHLWLTRDRSAHWTHLADLTVHAGSNMCSLTVDEWQPLTAIVAVSWAPMGASPGLSVFASYATFDGGASWRQLTGLHPFLVRQLATIANMTYASIEVEAPGEATGELAISRDQLHTWQPIAQTESFGLDNGSSGLWLDPKNGDLLVEGTTATGTTLWRGDDLGAHWSAVSTPVSPNDLGLAQIVVQTQAGVWHICIAMSPPEDRTPPNSLTCSLDGGQTWQQRPGLNVAFANPPKGTFYASANVFALDDSDAVLAAVTIPDFTNNTNATTFYRLPPRAQQWQRIGSFDGQAYPIGLYSTASGDVLWVDGQSAVGQSSVTEGWQLSPYP